MKLLSKLERTLAPYAVPNLTLGLIIVQGMVYFLATSRPAILIQALLVPSLVLQGEVWRLITFVAVPPTTNLLFAFFFWYMFYLMGTALEGYWGALRYNAFLLVGYVATVIASFVASSVAPELSSTNTFLEASVFLAFATVYPEFVFYIFFVVPVKVKWLAALQVLGYVYLFAIGDWLIRLLLLASIANYLLFFWRDIVGRVRSGQRHMTAQVGRTTKVKQPFHRCTVCGITDLTNPEMDFRYCTQCDGSYGYCTEHVRNHEHIKKPAAPTTDEAKPPVSS
jgi:membrane protein implicated in regulation of membrane protease activity